MKLWRYGGIVLVAALVATSSAACSGSDEDVEATKLPSMTTAPSAPSSTVPTTSAAPSTPTVPTTGPNVRPGEKPPTLDSVGKTNTNYGAVAFAQYWFQALDWGYATTDPTLAKNLYSSACTTCASLVGRIDALRQDMQHFQGGRITIMKAQVASDDNRHPGSKPVDIFISVTAAKIVSANGKVVDSGPSLRSVQWRTWLRRQGSSWTVLDLKRVI